jgi:hypothetical protein
LAVEQVAGRGRAQDHEPPLVRGQGKRDGQGYTQRTQQVGHGPSASALLAYWARTTFGHLGFLWLDPRLRMDRDLAFKIVWSICRSSAAFSLE